MASTCAFGGVYLPVRVSVGHRRRLAQGSDDDQVTIGKARTVASRSTSQLFDTERP